MARKHERFITNILPIGSVAAGLAVGVFNPWAGVATWYALHRVQGKLRASDDAEIDATRTAECTAFKNKF